jgi:hypothetical protein
VPHLHLHSHRSRPVLAGRAAHLLRRRPDHPQHRSRLRPSTHHGTHFRHCRRAPLGARL